MKKEQLIELSRSYFEAKEDLDLMYATSDNQFFYPEGRTYAYCHQRTNPNVILYTIKRFEAIKPVEVIEEEIIETIIEEIAEEKEEVIEEKIEVKPIEVKPVVKKTTKKKSSRNKKK